MNDLLRSLEGKSLSRVASPSEQDEDTLCWNPVYDTDREMEKLFVQFGNHSATLVFVEGYTDLIIDDEKLCMRSHKCNDKSLSRSKSHKSFGPVGNCLNSIGTGIPLCCHMSHHSENSTDIIKTNLMILKGVNNPKIVRMQGSKLMGDRGYNDDEFFKFIGNTELGFLNTTKRGPGLCFTFGKTGYKATREQREISEMGPVLSLGATREVGDVTSYLVAY